MAKTTFTAMCLLMHAVVLQAQTTVAPNTPAPDTDAPSTPEPVDYVGRNALSYLGYILLAIFLLMAGGLLLYVCYFSSYSYPVPFADNLKMQVPRPRRLMMTDLNLVEVEPAEGAAATGFLGDKAPQVSQAYLAWRRSQLNISVLLYIIVLILNFAYLHKDSAFNVDVETNVLSTDRYLMKQKAKKQLLQFIPLAQTIVAIAFYSASAWRWVSYHQSIRLVTFGWFLVFFLPFIYFFVPWMDIVSPKESVRGLCKYSLNLINETYTTFGTELRLNGKLADINSVCSERTGDMAKIVRTELSLVSSATGLQSESQLVLTFIGLLLRYVIYLPFLLGAMEALKSLAPGVLGLMLGLQGGLKMSKLMFPGVRVTSWMLIILQASALPIVMCIMALLLVVVGTIPVMATAVLITASMGLFLVYSDKLLRAVTRETAQALMTRITRIAIVLQILGLGFFLLGVYKADHLVALKVQGVAVVKNMMSPLFVSRLIMKTLAGMFVSKVVFVDVVLHIIISTYIGVYDDASETRQHVFEELTHFACLFPNYQSYKAVLPDDTCGDVELTAMPESSGKRDELNSENHLSINHGIPSFTQGYQYPPQGLTPVQLKGIDSKNHLSINHGVSTRTAHLVYNPPPKEQLAMQTL